MEGSLFTVQAQIKFLTAPPERLCQGKLALQNCSLIGKYVSLFISHSHWKKGGVGGWGVVSHDVILSTELLKGIAFHGDFQDRLCFATQYGTKLAWLRARVSLPSSPSTLLPPPTSFWGSDSRRVLQAALKRNLKAQRYGEVSLAFLPEVTCIWGNGCWWQWWAGAGS